MVLFTTCSMSKIKTEKLYNMVNKRIFKHYKIKLIFIFLLCFMVLFTINLIPNVTKHSKNIKYRCKDCNFILIVIDALRYDHLGCYGYEKNTSPNIDELCEKSIIFENTIAQSTWTKPSIISLFTSKYVKLHNITRFTKNYSLGGVDNILPSESLTLAEILSSNGYKTKALVGSDFIQKGFGLEQGFDNYSAYLTDDYITLNAINWLDKLNDKEKFFLYLHYMAPHAPYTPPLNYKIKFKPNYTGQIIFSEKHQEYFNTINMSEEDKKELVARYDGEINYIDDQIGLLIKHLKERKIINKTIIIITADHGESLGENQKIGHGFMINTVIQVPLIIFPSDLKQKKESIDNIVELIDIAPTSLAMLEIKIPESFQGTNILDNKTLNKDVGFSEFVWSGRTSIGIRSKQYLFISLNYENFSLYDIKIDPYQREDLAYKESIILNNFVEKLEMYEYMENKEILSEGNLSKEIEERLKSLGYIT